MNADSKIPVGAKEYAWVLVTRTWKDPDGWDIRMEMFGESDLAESAYDKAYADGIDRALIAVWRDERNHFRSYIEAWSSHSWAHMADSLCHVSDLFSEPEKELSL